MLAQLVQDLVHLEGGEDRLDQDGRPDRAARDAERGLAVDEDLVPEPRLVVRLELGQVEVRPAPLPRATRRRCGTGTARSRTGWPRSARRRPAWRLDQVPAARPDEQRRGPLAEPVGLALGRVEGERPPRPRRPGRPGRRSTFAQVGASASSRSAMNTRAPELSALIIILGSAGPVISTRRSSRSAGAGRHRPVVLADVARRHEEVRAGRRRRSPPGAPRAGGGGPAGPARTVAGGRRRTRARPAVRTRSTLGDGRAGGARPRPGAWCRSWSQSSPRRTVASMRPCGSVVGV